MAQPLEHLRENREGAEHFVAKESGLGLLAFALRAHPAFDEGPERRGDTANDDKAKQKGRHVGGDPNHESPSGSKIDSDSDAWLL